ncbi:asialoglycoprotein receptor 2 isoform X3 [Sebastes fasciatus]|uniref:asialoglycoprotein receptor 2 isoform X3 n=1 Tax=Sebastes fasciatus TaxID=394691 RepID=UPI003D9F50F1
MTTDYEYENKIDSTALWTKEDLPVSLSRWRRWLFPVLTTSVILVLIIVLGVSNTKTANRLWSAEQRASNLSDVIQSLNASLQHAQGSAGVGCCPIGWEQFGLNCYFFSSLTLSWNESRVWCDKQKAHLLIVHTDKAWDFVTRRTIHEMFWVGLSDWRTGRWEWVNQTPYNIERRRWVPGQPDGWTGHGMGHGDEDCGHLHYDGRLNDVHCTTKMRFICHKHSMRA